MLRCSRQGVCFLSVGRVLRYFYRSEIFCLTEGCVLALFLRRGWFLSEGGARVALFCRKGFGVREGRVCAGLGVLTIVRMYAIVFSGEGIYWHNVRLVDRAAVGVGHSLRNKCTVNLRHKSGLTEGSSVYRSQ